MTTNGPGGGPGTPGGGMDPKAAAELAAAMRSAENASRSVTSAFDQQLKLILQMRDAMNQVAQQMSALCKQDCGAMSPKTWQDAGKAVDSTSTALDRNNRVTQAVSKSAEKLSGIMKSPLTKALMIAAGALDGLKQGFTNLVAMTKAVGGFFASAASGAFNVAKSIIAIPFKMMKGLMDMAQSGGGGTELAQSYENVREEFGSLKSEASSTIIDVAKGMGKLDGTGVSAFRIFGNLAQRIEEVNKLAKGMGNTFTAFQDEIGKNGEAIMRLQRGLGITDEQMGTIAQSAMRMGQSITELQVDMTKQAKGMEKAFGINAKILSKDMTKALADVKNFGSLSSKELAVAATYAQKLGVSIDKLTASMDATKTFDSSAEAVSKLNEAFGTNIDATALMMEENPAKQQEMLRKALQATGKDMSKLNRFEREMIKSTGLMNDEMIDASFSSKNAGVSLDKISKQADKNANKTMTQTEALTSLADSIKRIVPQAGGDKVNSFLEAMTNGFFKGITTTMEFQAMLKNISMSFKIVTKLGFDLGRMFVKLFPGVQEIFGGIAELFSPVRYQKMADGVRNVFQGFNDGTIKSFDELMNKLREVFFDFFTEGAGPSKKILEGFKKFGIATIKIVSGVFTWMVDQLAGVLEKFIEYLKNPRGFGAPGADGFLKMIQPLIDAVMHAFDRLVPLILELLPLLGQKIYQVLTSEQFLAFLKKAGPIIAVVMFGPSLLKSMTAALASTLLSAAGDAVRSAFLGPGSKKITEMTGKELSKLMQNAPTPPPTPAAVGGGSVIPPGTPSPGETGRAQATGKIIDGPTIIKLLLALAAIITIGLVAFYAASQIVAGMDRKQIENSLLVLAGVSVAIIPAAFSLSLLSKIPATTLLAAIPTLVALGLVIPGMAYLGVKIAEMAASVKLADILKALLLVGGMSVALIPAASALATLAGIGSVVTGAAPLILVSLVALGLIVPAMALLGVKLAEMVAGVELGSILKALILVGGMSTALVIASGALATLAAAGALAGGVGLILAGVAAVGLVSIAMFVFAPELAKQGASLPIKDVLKAIAILGAMAVAVVEVSAAMVALAAAGVISALAGLILAGLAAFGVVAMAMLKFAPELAKASRKTDPLQVAKALGILAEMAVTIAVVTVQVALLAALGLLSMLAPLILAGIAAFGVISIAMLKFAPQLGKAASGISDVGSVIKSLGMLGVMALTIAVVAQQVSLLIGLGASTAAAPLIVLGLVAFGSIGLSMLGAAKVLEQAAKLIDGVAVLQGLAILGAMALAIVQVAAIVVLLVVLGTVSVLVDVINKGLTLFTEISNHMLTTAQTISESAKNVKGPQFSHALAVLGGIIVATVEVMAVVVTLVVLGALRILYPVVKIGMGMFEKVVTLLGEKLPNIVAEINKIGGLGLAKPDGPLKTLGLVAEAMGSIGKLMGPLATLGILKKIGVDIDGAMKVLLPLVTTVSETAKGIVKELSSLEMASGMAEQVKAFAAVLSAIAQISQAVSGSIGKLDFGWLSSAADKVKMMAKMKEVMTEIIGSIKGLVQMIFSEIKAMGGDKESIQAAEAMGSLFQGVSALVAAAKSSDKATEAISDIAKSDSSNKEKVKLMGAVTDSLTDQLKTAGTQITKVMKTIGKYVLPALKGFKLADVEAIGAIGKMLASLPKILELLQPPKSLISALNSAETPEEAAKISEGVTKYMKEMGPQIRGVVKSVGEALVPLIKQVQQMNMSPQQIETLAAVGNLLGAVSKVIGDLMGPMKSIAQMAQSGEQVDLGPANSLFGGQGGKTSPFAAIALLMDTMVAQATKLIGSVTEMTTKLAGFGPQTVEAVGKLGPMLEAIGKMISALMPSPELVKAISGADGMDFFTDGKVTGTMQKLGDVLRTIGAVIPDIMKGLVPVISELGKVSVTAEQVGLLNALSPIVATVVKMVSDMVSKFPETIPSAPEISRIKEFFESVSKHITDMFKIIGTQIGFMMETVKGLAVTMNQSGFKPEEIKAAADMLKTMIDMIGSVVGMTDQIKGMITVKGDTGGDEIKTEPMQAALRQLGSIVDAIFGTGWFGMGGGFAKKIAKMVTDPAMIELGKNKASIDALVAIFDFIGKIPGVIKALKSEGGTTDKGGINVDSLTSSINSMITVLGAVKDKAPELAAAISAMGPLGALKDEIPKVSAAFTNLGSLGSALKSVSNDVNLKPFEGIVKSSDAAADPFVIRFNAVGLLMAEVAKGNTSASIASGLQSIINAFRPLENAPKIIKDSAIGPIVKSLEEAVRQVELLDKALGEGGNLVGVKAKLDKVIGNVGLGAKGIYTVSSKEVVINVKFEVTMNAGAVERAIVLRQDSIIRDRINFALGAGGDDVATDASIRTTGGGGPYAPSVP